MRIPRSILIHNLQLISQTSESVGFDANRTGLLTKTDQATSKSAKEVIIKTFIQAADLEKSENRIWIDIDTKAYSLGHLIKDKTHLVPQDVRIQPLEDEVHDLLKVEVMSTGNAPYTAHVEESALKKSEMISSMLDDLPEGNAVPIADLGLNTDLLDLAFHFIKTGDLPSDLSTTDDAALLTFANFLDHPSFMDKIYQQLNNRPLKKEPFLSLPFELGIQWAKARSKQECIIFLSSFEGKDAHIENISLELINKGHLKVSDFENFDQVKKTINPSRIQNLDLSSWKQLTPEAFEEIIDTCSEAVSLKAPKHFTDQHLAHIKKLSNLQTLDLSYCDQIRNEGLAHLKELKNLQRLDLAGCWKITSEGLAHLKGLKNLQRLDLAGCWKITDAGLEPLKELKNLQTLDLAGCERITNDGLEHLKELKNLQELDLYGCKQITNEGLEHLKGLSNLETLNLSGCDKIRSEGLEHLKGLSNLETLNLSGCDKIRSEGLAHLKGLSNLETLNLAECGDITNVELKHLKELKNLQTLNLAGCWKITSEGLAHLKGLSNLETLNLFLCNITSDGLEHLKQLLPQLTIIG